MICAGIGTLSSSIISAPVKSPKVSGAIPSCCSPAFGTRSNVTGSFAARSRKGAGSSASVASTSSVAIAHNFFQSIITLAF